MHRPPAALPSWIRALASWLIFLTSAGLHAAERAYWVWHRTEPLTDAERTELRHQGVSTLYWHVASTREDFSVQAHGAKVSALAPGFRVIPVVRVEPGPLPPSAEFLKLSRWAVDGALQLDFDSRDRQLGEYAARLTELRAAVPHLGITALAHWPALEDFPALAASVEELCPMFYDLQADPTGISMEAPPPPLLDPDQVTRLLATWKPCPTRWRAGLPVFSRLTLFGDTGVSRGQIPGWEWDEVAFNKHLRTLAPTKLGVTLLRAAEATTVARRAIQPGETLAVRVTDRTALATCLDAAERNGAAGTVWFRLPARDSAATWSLASLAAPASTAPLLQARHEGDAIILTNESRADLPVRLSGEKNDRDRGYALEFDGGAAIFREAEPGEFFRVAAHILTGEQPRATSVPTATRLTFWFSHLPAGASLRSGLFQLAPAAASSQIRWRINGGPWQPLSRP